MASDRTGGVHLVKNQAEDSTPARGPKEASLDFESRSKARIWKKIQVDRRRRNQIESWKAGIRGASGCGRRSKIFSG